MQSVIALDIKFEIGSYKFIWDEENIFSKARQKIFKKICGISFKLAARVFLDKNRIDDLDELHSDFEERIRIIG